MAFLPINGDHAIQQVTFSILMDQGVTTADLNRLRSVHKRFREELPAVGSTQALNFQIDQATHNPQQLVAIPGIEFAYMRPDNTPAWKLRLAAAEVAVDCFRYTRWDKTWDRAHRYISIALETLSKPDPERKLINFGLVVLDRFKAENPDDSPRGLIRENPRFAPDLFSVGPLWHQHTGWFNSVDSDRSKVLTQLNIASTPQQSVDDNDISDLFLNIHHVQTWTMGTPIPIRGEVDEGLSNLSRAMRVMHDDNKAMILSLLEPAILDRIGLQAEQS